MAVIFALACLCCSALNDFIFKLFADRPMSRGIFFSIIGVVWTIVMAAATDWGHIALGPTVWWGLLSGFLSIVSNILLIEAMGKLSAGICSTGFRLNMVFVIGGAWLLLDERLTMQQSLGALCAVGAIFLFAKGEKKSTGSFSRAGLYMLIGASVLRAAMGLAYKAGFLHHADSNGLVAVNGLWWIAGGILYALIRDKKLRLPVKNEWIFGAVSGSFVVGIVFFMAKALQFGAAGVVLSIAQMSFLVTLLLSVTFLHEKLGKFKFAGLVCGISAILLLGL